jgi:mutator protein MutT
MGGVTTMKTTQITVITGIVIKDDCLLMVLRDEIECPEAHRKWELPGGKVDYGETTEEAIIREINEETGVIVKYPRLVPFAQTKYWHYGWGTQQTLCFCYICEYVNEKKVNKDHHVSDIAWVPFKEIEKKDLLSGVQEFVDTALEYLKN